MHVPAVRPLLVTILLASGGCAASPGSASWGPRWPSAAELGEAAGTAARSPATWVPLAGAAVLAVADLDEDVSDWGADHAPLFGDDAEADSDDLRSIATAAWLVTALAAPSDSLADKAGGIAVGAATLVIEGSVTDGIKSLAGRRRPDGSDDRSFTSGHAGTASAASTLARRNLDHLAIPPWLDTSLRIGLHGLAFGTGWARVEAEKHHVTDVLGGYAVGHFLAAFLHDAFMRSALPPMTVRFHPVGRGGAVTVVVHGD